MTQSTMLQQCNIISMLDPFVLFHVGVIFNSAQTELNHQKVHTVVPEFLVVLGGRVEHADHGAVVEAGELAVDRDEGAIVHGLFDLRQQLVEIYVDKYDRRKC